ncbi:MAG: S41 family peptidase, partial [Planctomycetota bacterium]
MKKLTIITLLLAAIPLEPTSGQAVRPRHTYENYDEFVQDVKKTITIERFYKVGTEENIVLEQSQAVRLDFEDNPAGVEEFIFFYNNEERILQLIYRCVGDAKDDYTGTWLDLERKKSYRGTRSTESTTWLWLFYEYEPKDNKAFLKFRSTLSLSDKDQEQIKEIEELRKQRKAENTKEAFVAKLREQVSEEIPYEFGTVKEVTIVPNQNAVRLKCGDNAEGVEEILIGVNSKYLYIYCVLSSGSISGGGSTLGRSKGSFRQVGGSAAIGMWERKDKKIQVKFQLISDDKAIAQSYKKLKKRGHFSTMIKNWATLFDDTELLFDRLTPEQRVEAFTRMWSTVKYNFANFDLVPEVNWDNVLSEYLPKVTNDQSNDEYILLLQQCIAQLKDGHTSVSSSWGNGLSAACPPLRIRSVGSKAIVTELAETEEIKACGIKPCDEITHVEGRPVRELLEKDIYPYISDSTVQRRDLKAYPRILQGPKESRVSLSIKSPGGEVRKISLTRKANGLALLPRRSWSSDFEYRDMGNDLAYVALNTFSAPSVVDKFKEKFKEISQAKGLIIDVRENGGGSSSNGEAIISCLIEEAIPDTLWKSPQHIAAFKAWGRPKKWFDGEPHMIEPRHGDKYLGPLVILIGNETF